MEKIQSSVGTTQHDPLSMGLYSLAVTPLIHELHHLHRGVKQVWYANDMSGGGICKDLKAWCIQLHLLFVSTVIIPIVLSTTEGHRHISAAIGSTVFF